MKNFVAAALLSVTALSGSAYAQTAQPADRTTEEVIAAPRAHLQAEPARAPA